MSIIITKFRYSETEAQIWYYAFIKPIWKNTIWLDTLRFKESNQYQTCQNMDFEQPWISLTKAYVGWATKFIDN